MEFAQGSKGGVQPKWWLASQWPARSGDTALYWNAWIPPPITWHT